MAMRVVTLERLGDYIEDKLGSKQTQFTSTSSIQFVDSKTSSMTCYLPKSQITNPDSDTPYLKFRDQVSGVLTICGEVVSDEDIIPYTYLLDF